MQTSNDVSLAMGVVITLIFVVIVLWGIRL